MPTQSERPHRRCDAASLANHRRATIRAIRRLVEPHFRDSGYCTMIDPSRPRFSADNRRPVRMWAPPGDIQVVSLRGTFKLTSFVAITEFGPMTDAYGGGMVWEGYGAFPLEDLMKLRTWAERTFLPAQVEAVP